jgi:dienelactone hydrolase
MNKTAHSKILALLMAMGMLLSGCIFDTGEEITVDGGDTLEPDVDVGPVEVVTTDGCENMNPLHCMLPFPSNAFLTADNSTTTGYKVNYASNTLPSSGTTSNVEIVALNRFDGFSPSTQLMTAFTTVPNLTGIANQHSIASSLSTEHATILLNLKSGERVAHWIEVDDRATNPSATIVFMRTLGALDYDTAYGVAFIGLSDLSGDPISPSDAMQAIIDGEETTSADIETRRGEIESLIGELELLDYKRNDVKAAWVFHTASSQSILSDISTMRSDALTRLGEDGIGCTVTSSEDNYGDDDKLYRRIRGTFTAPQYLESQNPPALIVRGNDGTPQYVEDSEIPFTMVIPQILADLNESGPLVVFGHGFLGTGEGSSDYLGGWAEEYKVSFVATDLYGWSSSDFDTLGYGMIDPSYFQHQAERIEQALINKMAMIRTFKGVCSDIDEMYSDGTNLVNSTDVHYMGYSLGGIYGASVVAVSPDIDRAALWVGGSGFSTFVERSTNFATFADLFSHSAAYPDRNDRALLLGVMQQMWDCSDPETFLSFANDGYDSIVEPFSFLSIISVNDAQVPGISSDRAARTAGIPVLDSSARLPYGVTQQAGPISGSAIVYWDGGYDAMPESNSPPPVGDAGKAHNEIGVIEDVNEMVKEFLHTGIIIDTCDVTCTFDYSAENPE